MAMTIKSVFVLINSKAIRDARDALSLSQGQLAARSECSVETIHNWEARKLKPRARRDTLNKVVAAINALNALRKMPPVREETFIDRDGEERGGLLELSGGASVTEGDLLAELEEALDEQSPVLRRSSLKKIIQSVQAVEITPRIARVASEAHSEIAEIERVHSLRRASRWAAIDILRKGFDDGSDLTVGSCLALGARYTAVIWDGFKAPSKWWRGVGSLYKRQQAHLDALKVGTEIPSTGVPLLTGRARLNRAQSYVGSLPDNAGRCLQIAARAAGLAVRISPGHPIALVELGQAHFAISKQANRDDWQHHQALAESALTAAAKQGFWSGSLVLARFLRQTYRPAEAIAAFKDFEHSARSRSIILKNAHIVAEAASQFWYQEGKRALPEVAHARSLVEEAIRAGYDHARHVLAVVMLTAIMEDAAKAAERATLLSIRSDLTWDAMAESAIRFVDTRDSESLREAFTYGMDNASCWNTLATFVHDFLEDTELALKLYEVALLLNPSSHIALTNAGRLLDKLGRHPEAVRRIQTAKNLAPPHFRESFLEQRLRSR